MTSICEAMRRLPDFDGDAARVALADGQRWAISKPWLERRARFRGGAAFAAVPRLAYGHEADGLLAELADCDDEALAVCLAASIAAALLRRNYDLAEHELDRLLAFRPSDPASLGWIKDVIEVATGGMGRRRAATGGGGGGR